MTERDRVCFGDATIEYEVRRSARRKKTIQITVDGGGVQVAAPSRDVYRRAAVHRSQTRELDTRPCVRTALQAVPKQFVSGETLPYLGRNVRMVVESAEVRSPLVRFDHWRFLVDVPHGLKEDKRYAGIRRAIVRWYRTRAAQRLPAGVDRWWSRLGRGEKPEVLIRDQRRRWASCAPMARCDSTGAR